MTSKVWNAARWKIFLAGARKSGAISNSVSGSVNVWYLNKQPFINPITLIVSVLHKAVLIFVLFLLPFSISLPRSVRLGRLTASLPISSEAYRRLPGWISLGDKYSWWWNLQDKCAEKWNNRKPSIVSNHVSKL